MAAKLAVEYRHEFKKDIILDFVCYRRRGHNETDEPFATQPLMYKEITSKDSVTDLYFKKLLISSKLLYLTTLSFVPCPTNTLILLSFFNFFKLVSFSFSSHPDNIIRPPKL